MKLLTLARDWLRFVLPMAIVAKVKADGRIARVPMWDIYRTATVYLDHLQKDTSVNNQAVHIKFQQLLGEMELCLWH